MPETVLNNRNMPEMIGNGEKRWKLQGSLRMTSIFYGVGL